MFDQLSARGFEIQFHSHAQAILHVDFPQAADKFGEATTHWKKLEDRVQRGVGNPCPLILIGLPASIVTFD